MYNHIEGDSSFNEILDMMKNFKVDNRSKDSSTIDFSERQQSRGPFGGEVRYSTHRDISPSTRSPLSNVTNRHVNVFEKLYDQKKQIDRRRTLLEYESKRSKQKQEKQHCTFSPNIRRNRLRTDFDSVDNDSFYNKNMQWQNRRQKSIKMMQCQKNQQNCNDFTFTPKINKFNRAKVIENGTSIHQTKGVDQYLKRQKKVKKIQQFVQTRKKNPYSHVWNVKKGHFSYIK